MNLWEPNDDKKTGLPFEPQADIVEAYPEWPYYIEFSPDYFID